MTPPSPFHSFRFLAPALFASAFAALLPACSPATAVAEAPETTDDAEEVGEVASAAMLAERDALLNDLHDLPIFSLKPLAQEPVPQPVGAHIKDQAAAIRLGKALFWDVQAGSDGQTACASCHFHAGADDRRINTVNPGIDGAFTSGGVTGPGQNFTPAIIHSDDRIGSQGMHRAAFVGLSSDPANPAEECVLLPAAPFNNERQVGFRHSPTVIGAVFSRDQFWGGEGNHVFNGLSIWGLTGNNQNPPFIAVENASLASQAVGPIGNFTEMSCSGRFLFGPGSLGTKMLARTPLQFQRVATDDSVLGPLANPTGPGLVCNGAPCTYAELIGAAFGPAFAPVAEGLFSLIWGEAVQAYEATLVPDQTPFDRFLDGDLSALTLRQMKGLVQFAGKGRCINCHLGPMLSDATVSAFADRGPLNRDGGDIGFHNIGVRPTEEDLARGDLGIFGGVPNSVSGSTFDLGAFKTPTLRNIKLTAPYFHTGGYPTLDDVVDFYSRGGDFANAEKSTDIQPRNFNASERKALVDFLANALTDCRVEKEHAPFDHPALVIPNRTALPAVGAKGLGPCKKLEGQSTAPSREGARLPSLGLPGFPPAVARSDKGPG